jgi:bifunctional pyridoxal-dependent enzyme with beta-cystathionase and maltose regulon repressor activities
MLSVHHGAGKHTFVTPGLACARAIIKNASLRALLRAVAERVRQE